MAQFLELCGNIGPGCRMTKTVIVGPDSKLINQILFVLSYFIRCSNVEVNEPPSKCFYGSGWVWKFRKKERRGWKNWAGVNEQNTRIDFSLRRPLKKSISANLSPQPTASSCYDNDLSPPLTDEMDDCVQNDSVECPINTSTSFSEKRRHTRQVVF